MSGASNLSCHEQDADGGSGQDSNLQALSRDPRFQEFVLRSTLRLLQAAAAGELPDPLSGAPLTIVYMSLRCMSQCDSSDYDFHAFVACSSVWWYMQGYMTSTRIAR